MIWPHKICDLYEPKNMLFRSITLWLFFGTKKNYMLAGFTFPSLNYFLRYLAAVEMPGSYIKIKIECKDTFWPVLLKVLYNFPKKEIFWSLRHFHYFFFNASEIFTQNNSTLNNTITWKKKKLLWELCSSKVVRRKIVQKNKPKTKKKKNHHSIIFTLIVSWRAHFWIFSKLPKININIYLSPLVFSQNE